METVGVYDAVHSAVIRDGWRLDSAKAGVLQKGERITAVRRRWISADTARLLIPERGWVSTTAGDGRKILARLHFLARRPLPVYSCSALATKPGHRLGNLLLWPGDVHAALQIREEDGAVEVKLTAAKHGGHHRGWVALHGLEQLPTEQTVASEPPALESASQLQTSSNAFDSAGRWTALPTAPSAALLFSMRWGDGGSDDPVLFVPSVDEIISLDELPGVGDRSALLGRGSFGAVFRSAFRGRQVAVKRCSVVKPRRRTQQQTGDVDVREVDRERLVVLNREVAMMRRMVGVPNVVQYVGVAQDERCCYIVMERALGGSLRTRLLRSTSEVEDEDQPPVEVQKIASHGNNRRRSKTSMFLAPPVEEARRRRNKSMFHALPVDAPALALQWCERATVAHKLARALTAMHAAGIIHRDLKAENILLDAAGEPLIADFGLGQAAAYATPATDLSESVAFLEPEPEPEPEPELVVSSAETMGRRRPEPLSSPSSHSGPSSLFTPSPGRQWHRQRNMTLLCGTPRFMAPEVAAGLDYDASVDLYSFGVLMVELLFRDVEACIATARHMETAEREEGTLIELELQLQAELRKQRLLSYRTGESFDLEVPEAECRTVLEQFDDDDGDDDEEEDDWRDINPATAQVPWRGLKLILMEQLNHVRQQVSATATSESKRRTLALAEQCCAPSAADRPTAPKVALELETIVRLAHAASMEETDIHKKYHSRVELGHIRPHHHRAVGLSGANSDSDSEAMDDPLPTQLAPPYDSDSNSSGSADADIDTPRSLPTSLQRTLSAQSARVVEVLARCDAERSLDEERREQENLDQSIESVRSEQDETAVALWGHAKASDMVYQLPRTASGEYIPAAWWAADHGRG